MNPTCGHVNTMRPRPPTRRSAYQCPPAPPAPHRKAVIWVLFPVEPHGVVQPLFTLPGPWEQRWSPGQTISVGGGQGRGLRRFGSRAGWKDNASTCLLFLLGNTAQQWGHPGQVPTCTHTEPPTQTAGEGTSKIIFSVLVCAKPHAAQLLTLSCSLGRAILAQAIAQKYRQLR